MWEPPESNYFCGTGSWGWDSLFCPRVNTRVLKSVHFGPLRNSKKRTIERFFFPSLFDRLKRHRFDVRDVRDQRTWPGWINWTELGGLLTVSLKFEETKLKRQGQSSGEWHCWIYSSLCTGSDHATASSVHCPRLF